MTISDSTRRYERSRKGSHLDTMYYEIDMLEFAFRNLEGYNGDSGPEWNLLIEGFLLHYRNIIEFFSGKKHRKGSDISLAEPKVWARRALTEEELTTLQPAAQKLEDDYWTDISQFLQHCTERRYEEFREWNLREMYQRLKPVLTAFDGAFPRKNRVANRVLTAKSMETGSTDTVTKYRALF